MVAVLFRASRPALLRAASLFVLALVLAFAQGVVPVRAQSEADAAADQSALSALIRESESLQQAYEAYTGQSLKEPANAGARRLSIKLDGLTRDLGTYLMGKADKKLVAGRVQEALTEAKRYKKSAQAKTLVKNLEGVTGAMAQLPKRLSASQVQWARNQTAQEEVAAAEPKTTPLESETTPAESPTADAAPADASAPSEATASTAESTPESTAGVERYTADPAESEAETEEAAAPTRSSNSPAWVGWVLFTLVIFSVGLLAALWAQGRQLAQLRTQLEDGLIALSTPRRDGRDNRTDEALTALREDLDGRWDELHKQTADFAQRLDARFRSLEDLGHRVTQSYTQLTNRLAGYEQLTEKIERLEATAATAPKTNGNHAKPADVTPHLPSAAPAFTPTDRELLVGLLDQLQATTAMPPLATSARHVIEGYQPDASPDPVRLAVSPLELAELLQLAYLSTLSEPTEDLYRQLAELVKREHLLVEDKMVGRMAFSDYYADNYAIDQLKEKLASGEAIAPWQLPLETIAAGVAKSPLETVAVKGTVLYTVLPAVLRQADGVKAVLRKGVYVIKA